MSSPVTWAVGSCLALAAAATLASHQLSRLAPGARPAATREPASVSVPSRAPAASFGSRVVTVAGNRSGHFEVEAAVEGRGLRMMVDTGATTIALTYEDAAAAGIRPFPSDFTRSVSTANGSVAVAPVRLREVRVGDLTVRDVEAVVVPRGLLRTSLLGMSFLRRLGGFDIANDRLTLRG